MSYSRTFIGIIWSSCQRFGTMGVSFICNLVLARLLSPKDFGTIGMLLFFISVANVFIDSGFGSAIIQKKNTTDKDYSTVFLLNILISVLLYILLYICAPVISEFYETEILTVLLRVEGLVLIGNALCMVQTSILRKKMNFRRLAIANLFGNTLGSIAAIVAAIMGCGVWSLVVKVVSVAYLTSLFLWKNGEWTPKLIFNINLVKELFSFGGYMLLSTSLNTIASNLQTLIIGRFFQQRILGLYTQAMTLRNVAADSLQSIIGQVIFPDFASLNNDNEIAKKLNNSFYIIAFYTTALLTLLLIIAKPLIIVLYTNKWIEVVPYFQILCIGGVFYAIQDVNYYVIAAKGRSKLLSLINIIKIPIYVGILILCGKIFGIIALIWCIVGYAFISYIVYAVVATRLISSSIRFQIGSLIKSILCSLAPTIILLILQNIIKYNNDLINIIIYIITYTVVLCLVARLFKSYPYNYVLNIIRKDGKINDKKLHSKGNI